MPCVTSRVPHGREPWAAPQKLAKSHHNHIPAKIKMKRKYFEPSHVDANASEVGSGPGGVRHPFYRRRRPRPCDERSNPETAREKTTLMSRADPGSDADDPPLRSE